MSEMIDEQNVIDLILLAIENHIIEINEKPKRKETTQEDIVRCKNCKHKHYKEDYYNEENKYWWCSRLSRYFDVKVNEDDYCSFFAERE